MVVGQNSGNKVERALIRAIDGKQFAEVPAQVQRLLVDIDPSIVGRAEVLHARKASGTQSVRKADLIIECGGRQIASPSVKSGRGNSVHQENIHEFVAFLRTLKVSQLAIDHLYRFHWGDGTTDGTGSVDQRIDAREIRARYPETISTIGEVFDEHQVSIVTRAIAGSGGGAAPSHLVYTEDETLSEIVVVPMASAIAFNSDAQSDSDLIVGSLLFQNYGRCLQGQDLVSNKTRNDVQFKWPSLPEDIREIYREIHEQGN